MKKTIANNTLIVDRLIDDISKKSIAPYIYIIS